MSSTDQELTEYYSFYEASNILNIERAILSHWTLSGRIPQSEYVYTSDRHYFYKKYFINNLDPNLFMEDRKIVEQMKNGELLKSKGVRDQFGITRDQINGMIKRGEITEEDYFTYSNYEVFRTEKVREVLKFYKSLDEDYYTTKEIISKFILTAYQIIRLQRTLVEGVDFIRHKVSIYYLKDSVHRVIGEIKVNTDNYFSSEEVCNLLMISKETLKYWKQTNRLSESIHYINSNGQYLYIKENVLIYKRELDKLNSLFFKAIEAASILNVNTKTLSNWIKRGIFSENQYKQVYGDYYYLKKRVNVLLEKQNDIEFEMYYKASELATKYGINKGSFTRLNHIDFFSDAPEWKRPGYKAKSGSYNIKIFHQYFINEYHVIDLSNYYSESEIVDISNSNTLIPQLINFDNDELSSREDDAIIEMSGKRYIKKGIINPCIEEIRGDASDKLVQLEKLAEIYSLSFTKIEQLLSEGCFGSIYVINNERYVYKGNCADFLLPVDYIVYSPEEEYFSHLPFSPVEFTSHYVAKKIIRLYEMWVFDDGDILKKLICSKKEIEDLILKINEGITHFEAAVELKMNNSSARALFSAKFESAYLSHKGYIIPKDEFLQFASSYRDENIERFYEDIYDKSPEEQLELRFSNMVIPQYSQMTYKLFSEYAKIRLSLIKGSKRNRGVFSGVLARCIRRTISALPNKDITELNDEELYMLPSNALYDGKLYHELRFFIIWLLENRIKVGFNNPLPSVNHPKSNQMDKEVYTANEYLVYFEYLMDVELHIKEALELRDYAAVWLYVGLHMNCEIRGVDLLRIPDIPIECIGITQLSYFNENRITLIQASTLIHFISEIINSLKFESTKSREVYVFIIHPEHMIAMATAFVIAELQRRKAKELDRQREDQDKYKYLIHVGGRKKRDKAIGSYQIRSQLKKTYRKKISIDPDELPPFESRKMNSSYVTYMFHALTQNYISPELATMFVKRMRGHKKANTTIQYILMNNKDGTIEQACFTLFRRKQFGWIFDGLAELITNNVQTLPSVRTMQIEVIRNEISLLDSELKAGSLLLRQKQNILEDLLGKNKKEISEFAIKLFTGQLPSRRRDCSCYIGKDACETKLLDCFECPFIIPTEAVLQEINYEIMQSLQRMKEENFEILLIKETQRICKLYLLVKEALKFLGGEIISIYLDLKEIKAAMDNVEFQHWESKLNNLWSSIHSDIVKSKKMLFRGVHD
jgi:hypothetical protein